jgi:hypothetical protein
MMRCAVVPAQAGTQRASSSATFFMLPRVWILAFAGVTSVTLHSCAAVTGLALYTLLLSSFGTTVAPE